MIITTKRMIGGFSMGDVVDFTRFRVGTRVRRWGLIVVCPTCGARGALNRHKDKRKRLTGAGNVTHRVQHSGWCVQPPSQTSRPGCASPTPDDCYQAKGTLDGVHYREQSGWHTAGWFFNEDFQGVRGAMLVGPHETQEAAQSALERRAGGAA